MACTPLNSSQVNCRIQPLNSVSVPGMATVSVIVYVRNCGLDMYKPWAVNSWVLASVPTAFLVISRDFSFTLSRFALYTRLVSGCLLVCLSSIDDTQTCPLAHTYRAPYAWNFGGTYVRPFPKCWISRNKFQSRINRLSLPPYSHLMNYLVRFRQVKVFSLPSEEWKRLSVFLFFSRT